MHRALFAVDVQNSLVGRNADFLPRVVERLLSSSGYAETFLFRYVFDVFDRSAVNTSNNRIRVFSGKGDCCDENVLSILAGSGISGVDMCGMDPGFRIYDAAAKLLSLSYEVRVIKNMCAHSRGREALALDMRRLETLLGKDRLIYMLLPDAEED